MSIEQLADYIMAMLRSLHEDESGWGENLECLLMGIAEVEGANEGYSADEVTGLSEDLIKVVKFARKASKYEGN